MPVRFAFPVAAVALAFIVPGQLAAQGSSSTEVRPAQMPERSQCDELVRRVEIGMPTAFGLHVRDAEEDLARAQELCASGQPEEGAQILREILNYMHEGP